MRDEASHRVSARAKRVWKRLAEFYGARIVEQFGSIPPKPWCDAVDSHEDSSVQAALVKIRASHLQFPPTLPEFEAALRSVAAPAKESGPDRKAALVEWIVRNKPLTAMQKAKPWTWRGKMFDAPGPDGKMTANWGVEFTGVEIPPDGNAPGYFVRFEDMDAGDIAA